MLIPNHPHDERLSALASGDAEAVADAVLSEHVASCRRCADTVGELGGLRASLAELPDLRPHRPLRLVPAVEDADRSRADRVGGWARRFFAPVLTAGAALAMVGLGGTTAPLIGPVGQGAAPDTAEMAAPPASGERETNDGSDESSAGGAAGVGSGDSAEEPSEAEPFQPEEDVATFDAPGSDGERDSSAPMAERSLWPMILFTGVALMVAAALMRWIMVPRAG
jgi:anti-sigma factor RsiW